MLEVEDQLAEYGDFLDAIDATAPAVSTRRTRRPRRRVFTAAVAVAAGVALMGLVLVVRHDSTRHDKVQSPPAANQTESPSTVAPAARIPAPSGCTGATPPDAPVPGCVPDADMGLMPDQEEALYATQPIRGLPVYDNATVSTVIGYLTDTGFVPSDLVNRYDDIKACNLKFSEALREGRSTQPSASCRSLLLATGVSPEAFDLNEHLPTTTLTPG